MEGAHRLRFIDFAQYLAFVTAVTLLVKPVGGYLERVFTHQKTALDGVCAPIERLLYRICRISPELEMSWSQYATCFVVFSAVGTVLLYLILRVQQSLPLYYPQYFTTKMTPDLAFNTAVSFSTTTTWQAYSGESTLSYVSQMIGLTVQNFLAGAAGLSIGIAFIRGFVRRHSNTLGNFWVDLTRSILWVLLPAAVIVSLLLVLQGVPMNWHPYTVVHTMESGKQVIAQGPVAALESIKNLGTNGGGFFGVNAAHPFEAPTVLANLINNFSIVVIPAALTYTFGRMVGKTRQGWMLYGVMLVLFVAGIAACHWAEQRGNPRLQAADQRALATQSGGNLEGKEVRFGITQSY
jgi:potassium-transporting ATPase potassium-binding subunit